MTLTKDERTVQAKVRTDPAFFVRDILGAVPYDKQVAILRSMLVKPRVSVSGANGTGKDFTTGRAVLWWLTANYPAKVIITGPTMRQVDDIVFNELRSAYRNSRSPLGGHLFERPRLQFDEQHFAVGFSTDNPFNLQGYHSPNLLVVVTEAHAMRQKDIEALRRLNPLCFIMTGNPFTQAGEFYASHHSNRHLYHTIEMSAFDTPNLQESAPRDGLPEYPGMVTKEDVARRLEEWGADNPLYRAGVLGEFPDNLDDNIVPLWAAMEATKRGGSGLASSNVVAKQEVQAQIPVIIAVDVARFGRDKTVVCARQDDRARIIWKAQGRDLMQICGWVQNYVREQYEDAEAPPIEYVIIDDTGLGGGVTDRLNEVGLPGASIVPFNGGSSASDSERYVNATSEAWMEMRKWFLGGDADIENDEALIGQLTSRGYTYQSDRRIKIQSKQDMDKSPDEADALAMTFAANAGVPNVRWLN